MNQYPGFFYKIHNERNSDVKEKRADEQIGESHENCINNLKTVSVYFIINTISALKIHFARVSLSVILIFKVDIVL